MTFVLIIILVVWFYIDPTSACIFLAILVVGAIIIGILSSRMQAKVIEENAIKEQQIAEKMANAENTLQEQISALIAKYGQLTKNVRLEKWCGETPSIKNCFMVFGDSSILYVEDKAIPFKDVISYTINDDYRIMHGEVKYASETNTSTGSLLGRSAAGAVIGGGVGALIGASSASKNTTTIGTQKDDTLIHKYSLSINIRSLESPLIRIDLGNSTQKVEEINAILAYIIDLKK